MKSMICIDRLINEKIWFLSNHLFTEIPICTSYNKYDNIAIKTKCLRIFIEIFIFPVIVKTNRHFSTGAANEIIRIFDDQP